MRSLQTIWGNRKAAHYKWLLGGCFWRKEKVNEDQGPARHWGLEGRWEARSEPSHPILPLPFLFLQPIWDQVRPLRPADIRQRLGAAGTWQCLSPGLLCLLLLQTPAVHRRGVWPGGGEGAVPHPLRHHDREPQKGRRERYPLHQPPALPHPTSAPQGPPALLEEQGGSWGRGIPTAPAGSIGEVEVAGRVHFWQAGSQHWQLYRYLHNGLVTKPSGEMSRCFGKAWAAPREL